MKYLIFASFFIISSFAVQAQELSKKLQKEKAAFEEKIAAEEKYNDLIKKADQAFRNDKYAEARAFYAEAIKYDLKQEAWLTSKINDLDILMAEKIVAMVDSIPRKVLDSATASQNVDEKVDEILAKIELGEPSIPIKKGEPIDQTVKTEQPKAIEVTKIEAEPEVINQPKVEEPKTVLKEESKPKVEPIEPVVPSSVNNKNDYSTYPYGVTEEMIDMKNHTIQRIVVVDSNEIVVYKRVKHAWGGDFTFKNDLSISQRIWLEEIERYREKFGDK